MFLSIHAYCWYSVELWYGGPTTYDFVETWKNIPALFWLLIIFLSIAILFSGGIIIGQLLEWLRWHFTEGEKLATEILVSENPERHSEYWDCVSVRSIYRKWVKLQKKCLVSL